MSKLRFLGVAAALSLLALPAVTHAQQFRHDGGGRSGRFTPSPGNVQRQVPSLAGGGGRYYGGHYGGYRYYHHGCYYYGGPFFYGGLFGYPYYYGPGYGVAYSYPYGGGYYYDDGIPTGRIVDESSRGRNNGGGGYEPGSLAAEVQRELKERGFYHGAIDGQFGSASSEALRRFQRSKDLPVTGRLDERTLKALDFERR